MNRVISGTEETQTQHAPALSALGVAVAVGVPMAVAVAGIATLGWDAVSWAGAIVWGIVATFAFWLVGLAGNKSGMTRMDLLDLLGSMFTEPHTGKSRAMGFVIHHMNGALLGIAWVYGALLVSVSANWVSGLAWGLILWVLALLLMSSIGGIHPAIRKGQEEDPGNAAMNFGRMTPMGSLMGHIVYGLVLGFLYQTWPL